MLQITKISVGVIKVDILGQLITIDPLHML